jgi:hypothetical protein
MNGLTLPKDFQDLSALDALVRASTISVGQGMVIPKGCYRYVKINRWHDKRIVVGQVMFLKDPETWEVTGKPVHMLPVGLALNNHRYHWWEYALWLLTRMIRFSPVRYVFIQESGYVSADAGTNP